MSFREEFAAGFKGAASEVWGCLGFAAVMLPLFVAAVLIIIYLLAWAAQ